MAPLEGMLQRRGAWRRWAPVALRLTENKLAVVDLAAAGKPAKEVVVVVHVEGLDSKQKNEEFAFTVHFEGSAKKGLLGGKDTKWLLKAESAEQYDKWVSTLVTAIKSAQGESSTQPESQETPTPSVSAPPNGDYSYGLPPYDPRSDLPIAAVPQQYTTAFAFLRMAVIHWMDTVKCLTADFGNETRIAILGDKCVYLCTPTADVKRCVRVTDIQKVLVAQDSKKDLYIIIVMPEKIQVDGKDVVEYDMMFHCQDIKCFVRYLRTVYMHATQGKLLPLEQLRDKQQLETEIKLKEPEGWKLNYWQPMLKEHLKTVLDMWQKSNKFEENEKFKQKVATMLGSSDVLGPDTTPQPPRPVHADPTPTAVSQQVTEETANTVKSTTEAAEEDFGPTITDLPPGGESDPLGRFLQQAGVAQYYEPLKENKITLDILNSGLIDDMDLQHFGVAIPAHRARILQRAGDPKHIEEARKEPERRQPPVPTTTVLDDDDLDLDIDLGGPERKEKSVFDDSLFDMDLGGVSKSAGSANTEGLEKEEANARSKIQSAETSAYGDIAAAHSAFAPVNVECDIKTPLGKFLKTLNLPQYYGYLSQRDISLETLACGLVDNDSLKLFGIENGAHRAAILKGLEDKELVGDSALDWISDAEDPIEPLKRLEYTTRSELKDLETNSRTTLITRFTEEMPAPTDIDITDPLARFLKAIGLPQYYWGLSAKDMSLDVLTSGLVDEDDLKNHCDIASAADRKRLQEALKDEALVQSAKDGKDLGDWSITGAARNRIVASQNKIMEIGGLSIDDDLLGGVPPPTDDLLGGPPPAVKKPEKKETKAVKNDDDDLLGGPKQPPPPADDDLLGGPGPSAAVAAPVDIDL
eukprot:TRINITY_DN6028_c0_g1_i1.p1 TRINITY_DN6028_c0_g1~~TRINITY_DN6028_c0_g1_i1.p1  ORF type:complete len:865 (+),score=182.14 TRINITY_DN6028_c0_g1_i1:1605-4199(+)